MPLDVLAELLACCGRGFFHLEWQVARARNHSATQYDPGVDPRLVVSYLSLGLRAVRRAHGATQQEIVRAAPHVKITDLRDFETPSLEPVLPTLLQLDEILRALRSDYAELEQRVRNPFTTNVLDPPTPPERPRPVAGGRLLSAQAAERLDLALRSLRVARGLTGSRARAGRGSAPRRR